MDLGFAGLIEEIEKRFGKPITNIVLAFLLIGILLWALESILEALSGIVELQRVKTYGI